MKPSLSQVKPNQWWGDFEFPLNKTMRWQIGPMTLWIQRVEQEWVITQKQNIDPFCTHVEKACLVSPKSIPNDAEQKRFSIGGNSNILRIMPRLANRPMVSRPEKPFIVPSGEKIDCFIGSILWLGIYAVDPIRRLVDKAIFQPSDTWFGPSNQEGQLCYACSTNCHFRVENIRFHPHRSLTKFTIKNRAGDVLFLDRLKIPANAMALYFDENFHFWTQDIVAVHSDKGDNVRITTESGVPSMAKNPHKCAKSRLSQSENTMVRAFSSLFS